MTTDTTPDPADTVRQFLGQHDIDHEVMACDPDLADTTDFCAHYGIDPAASGNTIIVASKKKPKRYVGCLVTATTRLDVNKRVRKLIESRASFATANETRDLTGMLIGGVTIFALPADLPLYVDARIMDLEHIWVGGGSRSWKIKVRPAELHKIPNLEVIDGLARAPTH